MSVAACMTDDVHMYMSNGKIVHLNLTAPFDLYNLRNGGYMYIHTHIYIYICINKPTAKVVATPRGARLGSPQ